MNRDTVMKLGASLYSFQEEYFHKTMSLEDILATCSKLDVRGIEILGDQMIPNYPNIPDEFIKQWHGWMDKYELTPVCLDMFLDWNKYKGREMSIEERVESFTHDIVNANKLGCSIIRVIHDIEPEIMEKALPAAEKYGVTLALEIHAPHDFEGPLEQRLIEMFDRVQSPYLGFTLDLGVYCKRLPKIISQRFLREGMDPKLERYLTESFDNGTLLNPEETDENGETLIDKVFKLGGREKDVYLAMMGTHMIYADPTRMLAYMPYIKHLHAKFYEMQPDLTEYSIPYEEIIPILKEGGYSGYLNSEYEGNRWIHDVFEVDSVEQIKLHHTMLKSLLNA